MTKSLLISAALAVSFIALAPVAQADHVKQRTVQKVTKIVTTTTTTYHIVAVQPQPVRVVERPIYVERPVYYERRVAVPVYPQPVYSQVVYQRNMIPKIYRQPTLMHTPYFNRPIFLRPSHGRRGGGHGGHHGRGGRI